MRQVAIPLEFFPAPLFLPPHLAGFLHFQKKSIFIEQPLCPKIIFFETINKKNFCVEREI